MNKWLIIGMIGLVIFSFGCTQTTRTSTKDLKNFVFIDTNSIIKNDLLCYDLCKAREVGSEYTERTINYTKTGRYVCDYEPVICENGECLCKTY